MTYKHTLSFLASALVLSACGGGGGDGGSAPDAAVPVQNTGNSSPAAPLVSTLPIIQAVNNPGYSFPNDGKPLIHSTDLSNFTCLNALAPNQGTTVSVTADGLVGNTLNSLLNTVGSPVLATLLASISNPGNVADGDLSSAAGVGLPFSLLGSEINSIGLDVKLPAGKQIPAGNYAAFAISVPTALLSFDLRLNVTVTTYLAGVPTGDTVSTPILSASLLGIGTNPSGFVGFQAQSPYDEVVISVDSSLLSVNFANNALNIDELCV